MKATILLADAAQVAEGKLYVLGGGWTYTGPQPSPMAVVLLMFVPWGDTNKDHNAILTLENGDGKPHMVDTPMGSQPLKAEAKFQVGRPPGVKQGSDQVVPIALNLPPMQLKPDSSYSWKLQIDGVAREEWTVTFYTRPSNG